MLDLLGNYTASTKAAAAATASLPAATSRAGLLVSRADVYTLDSATICLQCGARSVHRAGMTTEDWKSNGCPSFVNGP